MQTINVVNSVMSNSLKAAGIVCMATVTGTLVVAGTRIYKLSKTADQALAATTVTIKDLGDTTRELKVLIKDTNIVINKTGQTINTTIENLGNTLQSIGTSSKESLDIFNDAFKKLVDNFDINKYEGQLKGILDAISKAINTASNIAEKLDVKEVNGVIKKCGDAVAELKATITKVKDGEIIRDKDGNPVSTSDSLAGSLRTILGLVSKLLSSNNGANLNA